ncbi:MAG: hypothetical protein GF405_10395 [Candidatus Eisenbacteria bacterium]|nr:hypothetical protein [Candidatus Eisenbacteria bacterium]
MMRVMIVCGAALLVLAAGAAAQEPMVLEYQGIRADNSWPDDGSFWHTLHPASNFCEDVEQTGHDDGNGDGSIDVCESIQFGGEWHHIDWVGPTYLLRSMEGRVDIYLEPFSGRQHTYHEVYPNYCTEVVTTEPIEFVCQEVFIEAPPEHAGWWHVEDIKLNIRTTPESPVEDGTWTKIKRFFRDIF